MNVPYIYIFIHHQHSHTVTGIQKCLRARIMCRADCIVSIFFENTHFTFFCFRIRTCTKHAIIVMKACTAKNHTLSVNGHSYLRIPDQFTDSESFSYFIFTENCFTGIEIRVLCIPEFCVWNIQLEDGLVCFYLTIFFGTLTFHSQHFISLKFDFQGNLSRRRSFHNNLNSRRIIA